MTKTPEDYDDVDVALVFSRAALRLMEKWLLFVAGRDPALAQGFAEAVLEAKTPGVQTSNPDELDLEVAALGLQKELAAQVLSFLRHRGGRPQH